MWKDSLYHGKGYLKLASGEYYEGDFEKGKRNGYGTNVWTDGWKHTGYWKDNLRNGKGKETTDKGKVYEGEWINDKRK